MSKRKQFNFFMLVHFEKLKERTYWNDKLQKMKVGRHQTIYAAQFGPTIASQAYFHIITSDAVKTVQIPKITRSHGDGGMDRYRGYLKAVMWAVEHGLDIVDVFDGFIYYGHSSGWILGGWEHGRQFMSTIDLVDRVLKIINPKVVLFDACYFGLLSGLYEIARVRSIKYVLVSPSYHTTFGIFDTTAFEKLGHGKSFLPQLRQITCEYQARSWPKYRCFIIVDMKYINPLVRMIQLEPHGSFAFSAKTRISKKDIWTHDAYQAASNPKIKKLISQASRYTCGMENCRVIKGVSIERFMPDLHKDMFRRLKWYKDTNHIFHYE